MSLKDKLLSLFKTAHAKEYPRVLPRMSRDENFYSVKHLREKFTIPATFPFEFFDIIDNAAVLDPYIAKYVHTTVSLANVTHRLYVKTSTEKRANKAIAIANQFAARCYPLGGGMDGIVSAMLSQLARTGALCVEWAPDVAKTRVERAFLVPVKSLRFRYGDEQGTIELTQQQNDPYNLVPLNPLQVSYHGLIFRDTSPYPIPPILPALEACATHRDIMAQIKIWMQKVSSLGVMLAEVEPPPREPGETQQDYDNKAGNYLQNIADTVTANLNNGLGIGYNNIKFNFSQTASGAQGARDILQLVLQGMFSALQRDPIFFGWTFNSSDSMASMVYEEMYKSLKLYQIGCKRALEHGHRLNLALAGFGDVDLSIQFHDDHTKDAFKESEAKMMMSQAVISQVEAGIITISEARKLLGYEDKNLEAGAYVASFNRSNNSYTLVPYVRRTWSGEDLEK